MTRKQTLAITDICKKLDEAHIEYWMAGDTICAYVSKTGRAYDTIRLTEDGDIAVNGRIKDGDDFENWLFR